jgi:transcriptional regulator with XRE-family HTH domain
LRPVSPDHAALGRAIRDLRSAAGISQEGLADRCRLHRTYVGGIERGERNVSFSNLLRIAAALGVRPSELLAAAEALGAPAQAAGRAKR